MFVGKAVVFKEPRSISMFVGWRVVLLRGVVLGVLLVVVIRRPLGPRVGRFFFKPSLCLRGLPILFAYTVELVKAVFWQPTSLRFGFNDSYHIQNSYHMNHVLYVNTIDYS